MNLKRAFGLILLTVTIHAAIADHDKNNQHLSGEKASLSLG
jgi:hypothetical protein